eukprot:CAMPEP_0116007838 /NCGR_PEP_ID=MMETSP0321-20121206/2523_1 /TAXON_ID=163516 /ORGANISM="Leptocylindrus danicus var. danicus, Strain B650" /LENGTH=217 /DNA_ID=CAMNT_0003476581 /DNA_START=1680 /DNA_END=2334 /DNA_ORIENTATION=-
MSIVQSSVDDEFPMCAASSFSAASIQCNASSEVCANVILASPKEGEVVIHSKFPSPSKSPSESPSDLPSHNPSDPLRYEFIPIPSEEPSPIECLKLSHPSPVPSKVSPIESPSPVPSCMVLIPVLRVSPIFLPRFVPSYCPSNLPSVKGSMMSFGVPDPIGTRIVQQVSDEDPKPSFKGASSVAPSMFPSGVPSNVPIVSSDVMVGVPSIVPSFEPA